MVTTAFIFLWEDSLAPDQHSERPEFRVIFWRGPGLPSKKLSFTVPSAEKVTFSWLVDL